MFSIDSSGENLSPLQISDPLLRRELYYEIRLAQEEQKFRESGSWAYYIIQPADVLLPELIAYKVYGYDQLKWLIDIAAGLDDTRERLESGQVLFLPSTLWLQERITYYKNFESLG